MEKSEKQLRQKPATTPEEEENECIALAYSLVKKRLKEGTATSQETVHFLRAGSTKQKEEVEKLRKENDLLVAKVESLESQKRIEDLYEDAIAAMRVYSGHGSDSEEDGN